ncbi:MAG TPA: chromate transporter [Candidatus Methylomirabilis sp.]|nr:chromate transporter [Candidatus Methylomirabilis sp.]
MHGTALPRLFLAFLRLGATAYGGPAMMAYLRQECVGKRQWLSEAEFKEGMALCQVIPGATMMQMATYMGYRLWRLPGALVAALGFVLPAFLLMTGLSAAYFTFGELAMVKALFRGLAAIVVAIILNACVSLARTTVQDWRGAGIVALAFVSLTLRVNLLLVLVGAALLALAVFRERQGPAPAGTGAGR